MDRVHATVERSVDGDLRMGRRGDGKVGRRVLMGGSSVMWGLGERLRDMSDLGSAVEWLFVEPRDRVDQV